VTHVRGGVARQCLLPGAGLSVRRCRIVQVPLCWWRGEVHPEGAAVALCCTPTLAVAWRVTLLPVPSSSTSLPRGPPLPLSPVPFAGGGRRCGEETDDQSPHARHRHAVGWFPRYNSSHSFWPFSLVHCLQYGAGMGPPADLNARQAQSQRRHRLRVHRCVGA